LQRTLGQLYVQFSRSGVLTAPVNTDLLDRFRASTLARGLDRILRDMVTARV
jgi:hypothetical protein